VLDVNLVGAFHAAQTFGPAMVGLGRGAIINIGSLYASVSPDARAYDHLPSDPPFLKPPAYGASKAALVNLTRYLSTHWGPSGVRVNALSPGGVDGGQDEAFKRKFIARVPLGRMAATRDLGGPLIFLASDASSYVTGIELLVDGGYTAW
jgi:NAD(P)-dependent dehydrogenase (short-subunit alcohol dehydrogenase family)